MVPCWKYHLIILSLRKFQVKGCVHLLGMISTEHPVCGKQLQFRAVCALRVYPNSSYVWEINDSVRCRSDPTSWRKSHLLLWRHLSRKIGSAFLYP